MKMNACFGLSHFAFKSSIANFGVITEFGINPCRLRIKQSGRVAVGRATRC